MSTYPQDPRVNQTANKNNVRQAINRLAANSSLISKPDSNDIVFIYISTHGGGYNSQEKKVEKTYNGTLLGRYDGTQGDPLDEGDEVLESTLDVDVNNDGDKTDWVGIDESIMIGNETVDDVYFELYWDDEFKQDLDGINNNATVIVARQGCLEENMSCYQGGLIDDLSDPYRHRIIMSSSNETWYSYGSSGELPGEDGFRFSEWSERFFDALNGRRAFFDNDSNTVKESNTTVDADLNGDWRVSIKEAWNWTWNYDEKRLSGYETPWFDDNGNKLPTYKNESDYLDPDDGQFASQTFLPPLPVDLSVASVQLSPSNSSFGGIFQVWHHGMYLRGEAITLDYNVTVNRFDNHPEPSKVNATVILRRANCTYSCEIAQKPIYNLVPGEPQSLNLTWNETNTLDNDTWTISASVNSTYYEENPADNSCEANATVKAKILIGDIDHEPPNGWVNIIDAIVLGMHFGTTPSSPNWYPDADLNNDSVVNILDSIVMGVHFDQAIGYGPGHREPTGAGMGILSGGASVSVDPSQTVAFKGEVFSVSVRVADVTDLYGWQFKLYWNSTVLNCTSVVIQTPVEWQNNTQEYGSGLQASYNATHGRFWKAQSATDPAPSFNGSMTIATLTFQALQPGTTSLTLDDTILGNRTADSITHTVSSGSVSVYYGRYMRSDTQTVNGLNAYKLNIPQSTSYTYYTRSGFGFGASWGIRAWVRHSNGTEQEISLDGQTGTPKAVVSRGGGSGIQSGTVSVAQTGLQSTDSLVVRVYLQIEESGWYLCATFTTEQLQATTLQAATWTVYYYTYASYNYRTDTTTSRLYWGTINYNTRIQNLQYD